MIAHKVRLLAAYSEVVHADRGKVGEVVAADGVGDLDTHEGQASVGKGPWAGERQVVHNARLESGEEQAGMCTNPKSCCGCSHSGHGIASHAASSESTPVDLVAARMLQ